MQRLNSMHNLASNLVDTITPSVRKEIEHLKDIQRYWEVYACGDAEFGVNIEKKGVYL